MAEISLSWGLVFILLGVMQTPKEGRQQEIIPWYKTDESHQWLERQDNPKGTMVVYILLQYQEPFIWT